MGTTYISERTRDNGMKDDRRIYRRKVLEQPIMIEMTLWVCGEVDYYNSYNNENLAQDFLFDIVSIFPLRDKDHFQESGS